MISLYCGSKTLSLDRPAIMGIVNLTPDSFSGDGVGADVERAVAHAHAQIEAGADILDLGAESSRPGAVPVSVEDELARLLPVLKRLRDCRLPVSVDTAKAEVMRAALGEGAAIINDIMALRAPGALEVVAGSECAVCLMHMQGEPRQMQASPVYRDVVAEVDDFLDERLRIAEGAGISRQRCWIDPGFGFGKTTEHNVELFRSLPNMTRRDEPVLVGVSRKSMLGAITGRPVSERLAAGLAAALLAAEMGAAVVRVHDVAATLDVLNTWRVLRRNQAGR